MEPIATMDEHKILKQQLKRMIITECDKEIEADEIGDDELLIGGRLDLDSLDALQIIMAVKNSFGVRIEGGPAARQALRSVNSLTDTILAKRNQ